MKVYKIATSAGSTEYINAERSERDESRVNFFVGDEEVASFQSPSAYNIVEPVDLPDEQA